MARTTSLLLGKISGHVGRQIVYRQYGDITVISKYPDMSNRQFTPRQEQLQETMAEANYHAKGVIDNEDLKGKAQLRLNVTANKLYHALVREYIRNVWPTVVPPADNTPKKKRKR
jgi:hypothetical protein